MKFFNFVFPSPILGIIVLFILLQTNIIKRDWIKDICSLLNSNLYKKDKLICNTLGEHILEKYVEAKELEWQNYKTRISQWEIDEYLSKY